MKFKTKICVTFWTSRASRHFSVEFSLRKLQTSEEKLLFNNSIRKNLCSSFGKKFSRKGRFVFFPFDTKFSRLWDDSCDFEVEDVSARPTFVWMLNPQRRTQTSNFSLKTFTKTVWHDSILNPEHETPAGRTSFCRLRLNATWTKHNMNFVRTSGETPECLT